MATSKERTEYLLVLTNGHAQAPSFYGGVRVTPEERLALEKHDILLLLEQLADDETIKIKLILDRLYDLGSASLIEQKITARPIKFLVKAIAKRAKPVFRMVAIYWFKKNCPHLITDWLLEQVAFNNADSTGAVIAPSKTSSYLEAENRQIQQLRSQVKLLSSIVITLIVVFGGSFTWLFYDLKVSVDRPSIIKVDSDN